MRFSVEHSFLYCYVLRLYYSTTTRSRTGINREQSLIFDRETQGPQSLRDEGRVTPRPRPVHRRA